MIRKAFTVDDAAVAFFNTWNNTLRKEGQTIVIACRDRVFVDELPQPVHAWLLEREYSIVDVDDPEI